MVNSPMYERLMKFVEGVEESRKLRNYDSEHSTIIEGMGVMSSSVSHFKEYQGFEGQTGDAIDGWIDQAQKRSSSERQGYVTGTEHYVEGRRLLVWVAERVRRGVRTSSTRVTRASSARAGGMMIDEAWATSRSPLPRRSVPWVPAPASGRRARGHPWEAGAAGVVREVRLRTWKVHPWWM